MRQLWFTLAFCSFTPAFPAFAFNLFDYNKANCKDDLREPQEIFEEKFNLIQAFQNFRFGRQKNYGGFYLETKKPRRYSTVVEIDLPPLPEPFWKTETWSVPDEEVKFLSIGFQNLATESDRINRIVSQHVLEHPNDSLKLIFDKSRSLAEKVIVNVRWYIHKMVLKTYMKRKKYITDKDLRMLIAYNAESSHNDVFALMTPTEKPLEEMSDDELNDNILMTIQNDYFGHRNYLEPSLRGVLQANQLPIDQRNDRHAFEYRIPREHLKAFRAKLYMRFNPDTTCELIRYVRFGKIQGTIHDHFLRRAIDAALKRGCKILFAGADPATAAIFQERYLFEEYSKLPGLGDEVLLFHDVESDAFREFYNGLAKGSENVKVVE